NLSGELPKKNLGLDKDPTSDEEFATEDDLGDTKEPDAKEPDAEQPLADEPNEISEELEQHQFYTEFNQDIPNFAHVVGIPDGSRVELSNGITVLYEYDISTASETNLAEYQNALKAAGYMYEEDRTFEDTIFYSKDEIVVGLMLDGDFVVIVSSN